MFDWLLMCQTMLCCWSSDICFRVPWGAALEVWSEPDIFPPVPVAADPRPLLPCQPELINQRPRGQWEDWEECMKFWNCDLTLDGCLTNTHLVYEHSHENHAELNCTKVQDSTHTCCLQSCSARVAQDLCRCGNNSQVFCCGCETTRVLDECLLWREGQPDALWRVVILWHSANNAPSSASQADGQNIWPDCLWLKLHPSIIFLLYLQGCLTKQMGCSVEQNNATFYNARRSVVFWDIFRSLSL